MSQSGPDFKLSESGYPQPISQPERIPGNAESIGSTRPIWQGSRTLED